MSSTIPADITIPNSTELINQTQDDISLEPVNLSENSLVVLKNRYLKKDAHGSVIEEPHDMFSRVAAVVAGVEDLYGGGGKTGLVTKLFHNLMVSGRFMPNSPTLMNAGRELGQLSACFVLPIDDSMESIFESLKNTALIHKSGGGTGFSFSRLRPKNDMVKSTRGISSGPVSFMSVFDAATETIKQGGTRRGANMGILRVDHTDIREFLTCKRDKTSFNNFNISVAVTDTFMEAVKSGGLYDLVNPHTGQITQRENAREIFDIIIENAHATGDPGIIFIDRINEHNPLPQQGEIESTNPCGEQPLLPYESCNLGSVNLGRMVTVSNGHATVDWEQLGQTVRFAVRFLDNVIDVNKYPLQLIAEKTKQNRKIGLGVMGFADMLIRLGIPYDSPEAEKTAGQVMAFIDSQSKSESRHLAKERGAFPAFKGSRYDKDGEEPLRNATTTTIAPTGSISLISSCSGGIEPIFAVSYTRNVLDGKKLVEFHPLFEKMAKDLGIFSDDIRSKVESACSIQDITGIPEKLKKLFRTANDIPVEWHIRIQAAFQRHTDNAVSKTINFPKNATPGEVSRAFQLAFDSGLKGITVYRDGSKDGQVLTVSPKRDTAPAEHELDHIKPRPRKQITTGTTEKIKTGCGNLYVTINSDEEGLCEVFCQMGRSGGCTSSQSEAISRLISLALRSGVQHEDIVSELKGIRCPSPTWQNGQMILSCADAIATALSRYLDANFNNRMGEIPVLLQKSDAPKGKKHGGAHTATNGEMAGVCPDCNSVLIAAEGCLMCRNCGFTKCG